MIDANEMKASQISVFQTNLLHPTKSIKAFLESNSTTMIVVAPKGFGKTLLLKAKRLSITDPSITILPSGQSLLDKPAGSPSPPASKEYSDTRDNPAYWKGLWTIAIAIGVLKHEKWHPEGLPPVLERIFAEKELTSICDIFDPLLSASYADYIKIVACYNDKLKLSMRNISHNISIFIDNIDEYYEDMLRAQHMDVGTNLYGEAKEIYWYLAQLGIALASREINEHNSHIRVYASIRSEVKQRSITKSSFGIQLTSRSLQMNYSDHDLKQIIEKNILAEKKPNLLPGGTTPIDKFLGKDCISVFHPKTGDQEDFLDFWIRHTLRRPRDIVLVGRHISALEPRDRNARSLRQAVRTASREIARGFMAEMEPHLAGFDPDILIGLIRSNTLSAAELARISAEYAQLYEKKYEARGELHTDHVFCALYKIGLLGVIRNDEQTYERIQDFLPLGSVALDEIHVLPDADLYLIHPILDDLIGTRSTRYFNGLNDLNVIGAGRRWRDERSVSYVLKGDLKGYSEIMKDVPKSRKFKELLDASAREYFHNIDHPDVHQGDSILLIDTNPVSVITAARAIEERIANSEFKGTFRFGGEAGYVMIDGSDQNRNVSGMALRTAARLEPHVTPGEIWVTEDFVTRVKEQFRSDIYQFEEIAAEDAPALGTQDGRFNLAKNERDEPIFTKLFRVRPL
ncbi:adenylate/guanylate cyclase domain-containing protein [Sphingomonas sp. AP4-R1]|uniref:adenylate/guanylate cyclase domain-containing protein n=1 Tax=Sphingomonas sp. AP4-R1 TaxID=2735134 RepID=UPI001493CBCE|nr:adenylate/guanylate cyclase domain-containing protein [Sphingomonas sp. AP4-R1]QJU58969.1 adenylate/guanylate cyclase domain-containing protein [Sphingomonas sp. AP4-R1]